MHSKYPVSFALAALLAILTTSLTLRAQNPDPSVKKKQYVAADSTKDNKNDKLAITKGTTASAAPVPTVQPPAGYRVGVDDELLISVWHEAELSQAVVVRPDGMITLPLLNDIKVVGLTPEETQSLLTERLKPIVNEPQVTVTVKAIKSRKVFLVGNATKQGAYALGGRMTVLELLAEAGGLGPFAKTRSIYVLRNEKGKEVRLPFNYKRALSGKGVNYELLPGDMVVVP
jgi:polysaccharide export outer membrane protein